MQRGGLTEARGAFAGSRRFELIRKLGAGGMGIVYEAHDRVRNARVALKTLLSLEGPQLLRFKNEFRALQDIRHPNLVGLGELVEDDGHWFFTMELLHGVDFYAWVRPGEGLVPMAGSLLTSAETVPVPAVAPGLPPAGAVKVPPVLCAAGFDEARVRAALQQVAAGLLALHAGGKVHRDVKPSNILVTDDGRAVVLDFGLVADARGDGAAGEPLIGTVPFMSPEQAARGTIGPEADWYSVGVLLYLALTGRLPFSGAAGTVLLLKQREDAPDPARVIPSLPADLCALCSRLLQRDPARRATGQDVLEALSASLEPSDPAAPLLFVGRQRELGELDRAYAEAAAGRTLTLLVQGESGQGKSALVREFVHRLAADGGLGRAPLVLAGRCYERESVPYKALDEVIDSLSRHLAQLPEAQLAELLPSGAAVLADVFPVLATLGPLARAGRDPARDPQELRARVFGAVRTLLFRLGRKAPLVLAIDDLQWADADGLALLAEILRPPNAPPLLCIATVRTSASQPTAVAALSTHLLGEVRQLHVESLLPDDARVFVARLTERARREASVDTDGVLGEAGGHPFFLDALVRYRLVHRDSGPVRLDDALWWRISRLTPPARRVLELVAVCGVPLRQETAARASATELEELSHLAAQLRASNLVRTSGAKRSDTIEPYHDRVRETVLAHLAKEALSAWHGRLALALESTGASDAELLAVHWRGSGDLPRAARYLVRAAGQARYALAFDRAARLYREALALLGRDSSEASPLRVKLADALVNAGRSGDAGQVYLEAAAGAPLDEALDLQRRAAEQLLRGGQVDRGLSALGSVLGEVGLKLPSTPRETLLSLLYGRARLRLRGLKPAEPSPLDPRDRARMDICHSAAVGLGMVDNLCGADFQTRSLLLELKAAQPERLAVALSLEACFVSTKGQKSMARAARLQATAAGYATTSGDPLALAWAEGAVGVTSYLQGRFRAGLESCRRAQKIFLDRCAGVAWEVGTLRVMELWCLWYLGELETLRARARQYAHEAEARGDLYALTNYRLGYVANGWLAADDPSLAREQARLAMGEWSQHGYHLQHFYHLYGRGQLLLYEGDAAQAHALVCDEWPRVRGAMLLEIETNRIYLSDLRARCALALSNRAESEQPSLLRAVGRDAKRLIAIGAPASVAMGLLLQSRRAAAEDDLSLATDLSERAAQAFRAAEMPVYRAAADYRRGELLGGPEGKTLVGAAAAELRGRGVERPARLVALLAP